MYCRHDPQDLPCQMPQRRGLGCCTQRHRPASGERVNGSYSNEEILAEFANFGITPEAVTLWGTGKPLREFLWSEEMADASVHVLLNVDFKDTYAPDSKEYATATSMWAPERNSA